MTGGPHAIDARRRAVQNIDDAAVAPQNRAALESLCASTALARTSLAATGSTAAGAAGHTR
jgi:hypothetical protein